LDRSSTEFFSTRLEPDEPTVAGSIPTAPTNPQLLFLQLTTKLHSVRGQGVPIMKFRGGEFSTGTMGNFQPELTQGRKSPLLTHTSCPFHNDW
jgi:hypothetical protein